MNDIHQTNGNNNINRLDQTEPVHGAQEGHGEYHVHDVHEVHDLQERQDLTPFGFLPEDDPMEEAISNVLEGIRPVDAAYLSQARAFNDALAKPLGSLGRMEEIRERMWAIGQGELKPFQKGVIVYAGDNGVCAQGVSSNPQDVTWKVCQNILSGRSGLGRIAAFYGVDVHLEDLAVLEDVPGHTDYKLRRGTGDIRVGPAMDRSEAAGFVLAGIRRTDALIDEGYNLIGAGEMGVGNTTTSSAVLSVLTGVSPEETTGYGSGITRPMRDHKIQVVKDAIRVNEPYRDILDVLARLSGADICAMAGTYLACAARGIPFVLDGVISMAALAAARSFSPQVMEYCFPSHRSQDAGARAVENVLGIRPMLDLDMRLGEGSGCPLAMDLIECALYTLGTMATFDEVSVDKNDYIDIREESTP